MQVDDMLQYFTDLSLKMDGSLVLRKGRQLLLKFRQLPYIPCCVRGLLSGPGVWDSAPLPLIECHCHGKCRYDEETSQDVENPEITSKEGEREKYQDELPEKFLAKQEAEEKRNEGRLEEEKVKQNGENTIIENRNDGEIISEEEKSKKASEIISEHKDDDVQEEKEDKIEEATEILEEEKNNDSKERGIVKHEEKNVEPTTNIEMNDSQKDHQDEQKEDLTLETAKTNLKEEQDNKTDKTIKKTTR